MDTTDVMGRYARHALRESRRCTARSKATGEQCGRAAIPYGTVCPVHGGSSPQAQAGARRRERAVLMGLVPLALNATEEVLTSGPACEVCGRRDRDNESARIKAAQMIFDRTGYHPTLTLRAETAPEAPWAEFLTDDEMAIVGDLIAKAKERLANGEEPPVLLCHQNNDVVEAELPDRDSLPAEDEG